MKRFCFLNISLMNIVIVLLLACNKNNGAVGIGLDSTSGDGSSINFEEKKERKLESIDYTKTELLKSSESFPERYLASLFEYDGELYLLGGISTNTGNPEEIVFSDVWNSIDGIHWERVVENSIDPARISPGIVIKNDKILALGGQALIGTTYRIYEELNDAWESVDGITWKKVKENCEFTPRAGSAIFKFGEKYYLLGGYNLIQDPKVDIWSSIDGLMWKYKGEPFGGIKDKLVDPKVICNNGNVFLFDRQLGIFKASASLDWNNLILSDEMQGSLFIQETKYGTREGYGLVEFLGKIILFGGSGTIKQESVGSGLFNDVWESSDGISWNLIVPVKKGWENQPKFIQDRYESFPARSNFYYIVFRNHIFMYGGIDQDGEWIPETWVSPNGINWYLIAKTES